MVRIRSEHAIGFLKGRFSSLKHLRINIVDEASHAYATYWIAACICLHNFAMECEEDSDNADTAWQDPFIDEGLSSASGASDREVDNPNAGDTQYARTRRRLRKAKAKRETLKEQLFHALDGDSE